MRNHYLITRFNLKSADWNHTKNGDEVLTDLWLEERFYLFENYCLPSVKNQTNQDFKWCVFFDEKTPQKYVLRISRITQDYPNFKALFIKGMESLTESFIKYIEESISDKDKLIITSRLDNDDIIHKDFVEIIQNYFVLEPNCIIDLRKGYQVTIESKQTQIRSIDFQFNQFVSYVEEIDKPIKTVMDKMHREWKNNATVKVFNQKELWIELIHLSNKLNTTRNEFNRIHDINNTDFGISKQFEFKDNLINVLITNFTLSCHKIKVRFFKKLKNKLK